MPESPELTTIQRDLDEDSLITAATIPLAVPTPTAAMPRVAVVPIQVGGTKRPLFYLHVHVTGGAFYNFALARDLGPDQPFYMLDPYRLESDEMPPSLETMAAAYIEALRTVQPEGPYLLSGFCGGGIIAFEMAQQLRAQGQDVDLLILIEPRDGPAPHRLLFRKLWIGAIRRIGALCGRNEETQLEWFLRFRHVGLQLAKSEYRSKDNVSLFPPAEVLRRDWIGTFVWIISRYHTRRYPGKAIYFWAREEPKHIRRQWGEIKEAEELEEYLIPGSHTTCRTTHLHEMAGAIEACLSRVQPK
jgi:pimeloyl-ACP methyl ester carboxylesterase